jgi:hypothetical protein
MRLIQGSGFPNDDKSSTSGAPADGRFVMIAGVGQGDAGMSGPVSLPCMRPSCGPTYELPASLLPTDGPS